MKWDSYDYLPPEMVRRQRMVVFTRKPHITTNGLGHWLVQPVDTSKPAMGFTERADAWTWARSADARARRTRPFFEELEVRESVLSLDGAPQLR